MSKKPVSAAQLAANRANAKKSTGPRTATGKASIAANAVKHGLLSDKYEESPRNSLSLCHGPGMPEEHFQYHATLAAFTADFAPSGAHETYLVRRLASIELRLARITRIESGMITRGIDDALQYSPRFQGEDRALLQECPTDSLLAGAYNFNSTTLNLLSFYESRLARDFHRTVQQLRQAQELRVQRDAQAECLRSEPIPEAVSTPTADANSKIEQTNPICSQGKDPIEVHRHSPAPNPVILPHTTASPSELPPQPLTSADRNARTILSERLAPNLAR